MWKYYDSIFQLGFLIFYIIFLSFISFLSTHVSFIFFIFLVFLLHASVQCPISIPPFFYFLFHLKNIPATSPFTSHQRKERERERGERLLLVHRLTASGDRGHQKDKAGKDRRSPCSTTTYTAPLPLVLLHTTKLGQISLFFFFFPFFFHICLFLFNFILRIGFCFVFCVWIMWEMERMREKKKSGGERKNWYNSSWYNFLSRKIDLELLQYSLD